MSKICPTCGEWEPCVRCPEPIPAVKNDAKPSPDEVHPGKGKVAPKSDRPGKKKDVFRPVSG